MITLEFNHLLEAKSAQCDSLTGVLPTSPSEILSYDQHLESTLLKKTLTGLGKSHLLTKTVPAST